MLAKHREPARLLVVPGLHDSGPTHWQSWLQAREPGAVRVQQRDWHTPALDEWAQALGDTLQAHGPGRWVAVAHSFGCLALARHLQLQPDSPLAGALLVAPADPEKFGVGDALPRQALPIDTTWVASTNDPWMSFGSSLTWSGRWGCRWVSLGAAGHINAESGFGPLPLAAHWVRAARQKLHRRRRPEHAELREWSFSV
jgi:predicted alpha/beta hydrolase family esterase